MKKEGYYSSGEFARMAHVTLRTIRYYDKQNILKPSYVSDAGARFYTDEDLARLQQILLLKFLGFSLDDIRDMTINDTDYHFMRDSLDVQLKLVRDRIEQLQLVEKAIQDTSDAIQTQHTIDWNQMLDLIHLTGMEKSMKNQYQNATNIAARIKLHSLYSINKEGWFPWIYSQCHLQSGMNVWNWDVGTVLYGNKTSLCFLRTSTLPSPTSPTGCCAMQDVHWEPEIPGFLSLLLTVKRFRQLLKAMIS